MEIQEDLKIIIKKLNNLEESVLRIEETINSKPILKLKNDNGVGESSLDKMSKKLNLKVEDLKRIYEIENEDIKIITPVVGKNEPKKQINASLLILGALYHCFGRDIIQARELNRKLEWLGIKSVRKLSVNLKKSNLFLPVGKNGSHNFSYKITFPGLSEYKKIIEAIILDNNNEVKNG